MKKYIAKTNVSINVILPSGANRHIAFSAVTGGGSVYYTDDPDVIQAIERHYKFGTLFRIDPRYEAEKQQNKPVAKAKAKSAPKQPDANPATEEPEAGQSPAEEDGGDDTAEDGEDTDIKKVVVSDPDSAKAYLAEQFGYSRTKIKTIKAIKEAAASHGIVFEGI